MAREGKLIGGELEGATLDDELEVRNEEGWFTVRELLRVGDTVFIHYAPPYDDEESDGSRSLKELKTKPINDFVRVTSAQLQDEDCANVSLGDQVCAFYQAKKRQRQEGWFDALIMERTSVRHRTCHQQEYCPCRFTVKWIDGPRNGKQTRELGCGDICQLSTKCIDTHPVVVNIFHRDDAANSAEVSGITYKHNVKRPRKLKLNDSVTADDVDDIPEHEESVEPSQSSNVYFESAQASAVDEVEDLNEVFVPYEVQGHDELVESDEVKEISELPEPSVPIENSEPCLSQFLYVESASFHDYREPFTVDSAPDGPGRECSDGLEGSLGLDSPAPFGESEAYKARKWRRLRKSQARKTEERISRSVMKEDVAPSATEVERRNTLTNSALPSPASSAIPGPTASPLLVPLQDAMEVDGFVAAQPCQEWADVPNQGIAKDAMDEASEGSQGIPACEDILKSNAELKFPTPVPADEELLSLDVKISMGVKETFDNETQVSQFEDLFGGPSAMQKFVAEPNSGVYASLQAEYSAAMEMLLAELTDDTPTRDCAKGELRSGQEHFDPYGISLDSHQSRQSEESMSPLSVLQENSEYVLTMVDNLESDVEPAEVFDQLSKMCCGQVHSVHIPPVSSLTSRKGYVILTNHCTVEAALALLDGETNFVISPGGRPWIFTKADPSELDLDPATVSAYMGAVAHRGRSTKGLHLISACTHPHECLLAKQQKELFEQQNVYG